MSAGAIERPRRAGFLRLCGRIEPTEHGQRTRADAPPAVARWGFLLMADETFNDALRRPERTGDAVGKYLVLGSQNALAFLSAVAGRGTVVKMAADPV
jgi:hypothetical protein